MPYSCLLVALSLLLQWGKAFDLEGLMRQEEETVLPSLKPQVVRCQRVIAHAARMGQTVLFATSSPCFERFPALSTTALLWSFRPRRRSWVRFAGRGATFCIACRWMPLTSLIFF